MFIESLGEGYASDNLYGAHFIHEGKLYSLRRVEYENLRAWDVDANREVVLDNDILTGWKSFKYPRLGYRRITDTVVGTVLRTPRSYTRGLSIDNTQFYFSDVSRLINNDLQDYHDWLEDNFCAVLKAAMLPVYDGQPEWQAFLRGERAAFVPSHDVLVERPSPEDKASVYMSRLHIGYLHNGGKIEANAANASIINRLVRKYAN